MFIGLYKDNSIVATGNTLSELKNNIREKYGTDAPAFGDIRVFVSNGMVLQFSATIECIEKTARV